MLPLLPASIKYNAAHSKILFFLIKPLYPFSVIRMQILILTNATTEVLNIDEELNWEKRFFSSCLWEAITGNSCGHAASCKAPVPCLMEVGNGWGITSRLSVLWCNGEEPVKRYNTHTHTALWVAAHLGKRRTSETQQCVTYRWMLWSL